jgi:hypothetical protein
MAWTWEEFKAWTWTKFQSPAATTAKVVVAGGLLAAGGLLWYERAQPRYPTARDEATIIGAFVERDGLAHHHTLVSDTEVKFRRYPVLSGSTWTNEAATNAVGLYPDRSFYLVTVTNLLHGMESVTNATSMSLAPRWIDLATGSGAQGSGRLTGRAWNGVQNGWWEATPFKTNEIMNHTWWQSNIWTSAPHYGALPYTTNRPFYIGTNMLNQIGKALTAYRWTWEPGSDVTNQVPIIWATVATGTSSSEEPGDVDAHIDAAIDALEWTQPNFTAAELEHRELAAHYAYIDSANEFGATVKEAISTRLIIDGLFGLSARYFAPSATGTVAQVTEHGVIVDLYADALPDGDQYMLTAWTPQYYHNRGFDTNIWERVIIEAEDLTGHTTEAYRAFIRTWDGPFDAGEMKTRLNSTGSGIMGWASGPAIFVVDWRFQCLTNRAAFWD